MSKIKTEFFSPQSGDYILVKVPIGLDGYTFEEAKKLHEELVDKFCNNIVITIPADINVEFYEKEELIEFFTNTLKQLKEEVKHDNLYGRIVPF